MLSPVFLPFKCTFQEMCHLKIRRGEILPESFNSNWIELTDDMTKVSSLSITP